MSDPFLVDGNQVEDSVLYFWALQSVSRALRFAAEARQQVGRAENGHVLATIAGYYAMFHVGTFLCCGVPQHLKPAVRKKLVQALGQGKDPSRTLSHNDVLGYMRDAVAHGLPAIIAKAVEEARKLREFVNYGPDLRHQRGEWRVFNRDFRSSKCVDLIRSLDGVFLEAVNWASRHGLVEGYLITAALDHATDFFTPNADGEPFYSDWSSAPVLSDAESMRAVLAARAQTVVADKRAN